MRSVVLTCSHELLVDNYRDHRSLFIVGNYIMMSLCSKVIGYLCIHITDTGKRH